MEVKILLEVTANIPPADTIDQTMHDLVAQKSWNGLCATSHRNITFQSVQVRSIHPKKKSVTFRKN